MMRITRPNCYKCIHRHELLGDAHSGCRNFTAQVEGNPHGIKRGWFNWPLNFDPVWLISCDGFEAKEKPKTTAVAPEAA